MSNSGLRTFIVYVEDKPGVLNRVISLFRRRNFNIESLTVGRTDRPAVSCITMVAPADDETARRMEAYLYKLVNVLYVKDVTNTTAVVRELALIKVRTDEGRRSDILQVGEAFRARVVSMSPDTVTFEATGVPDKINGLLDVLRPYGIQEMVRTGVTAMVRGVEEEIARAHGRPEGVDEPQQSGDNLVAA